MSGAGPGRVKCAYCHRSHRAGVECPVRNREEALEQVSALKRVEAFLNDGPPFTTTKADLHAVLALAKSAEELRRRIKAALATIPPKVPPDEENARHWYSRVSARTVDGVEEALRKPARGRRGPCAT